MLGRRCSHLVPEHRYLSTGKTKRRIQTQKTKVPKYPKVPMYKVKTLYSGTGTVSEFWRGSLKKEHVHISAQGESYPSLTA